MVSFSLLIVSSTLLIFSSHLWRSVSSSFQNHIPSVAEAFGLVLAEALYLGTPVVASRVGGIPEIVEDGIDGVLAPPADAQALADTIADLLNASTLRQQMAGAGREKVIGKFRFEDMVQSYEAIYQRLTACAPGNSLKLAACLNNEKVRPQSSQHGTIEGECEYE